MRFTELMESELDINLKPEVDRLLDIKMNSPEQELIPRVDKINLYLDLSIEEIGNLITKLPEKPQNEWNELNRLFLDIINN